MGTSIAAFLKLTVQEVLNHAGQVVSDEAAKHDPHLERTPVGKAVSRAIGLGLTGWDDTILVAGF